MSSIPAKIKAWSHSRLQTFEQCAYKYYRLNILKDIKEDFDNEFAKWGTYVHECFERRLKHGTRLPRNLSKFEPLLAKIENAKGDLHTELEMTLNDNLETTGWFDDDAYIRAKIDVLKVNKTKAWYGDYKTGKQKKDDGQLKLCAALIFHHFPEVEQVYCCYLWLQDMDVSKPLIFNRHELSDIWDYFLPRAHRIEDAIKEDVWVKRPSGLCNWCAVKQKGECDGRS